MADHVIPMPMEDVMARITLRVRFTGIQQMKWRLGLAIWMMKAAAWMAGTQVSISVGTEPATLTEGTT